VLIETDLTGKHEIMKTGEKTGRLLFRVPIHVFMLSCFPVEKG
jgi:hypothetical protein